MARVPYLNDDDLAADDKELLARPINLFRALANSPEGLRRLQGVGGWIRFGCELDPRHRELAILQVGYLTATAYEWSHHVKIGQDFGVTEQDIRSLIAVTEGKDTGGHFSSEDHAILASARELTSSRALTDDTAAALKTFLSDARLVDLVIVISYYNSVVRVLGGLQIDIEDGYQPYLREYPLGHS
ncbi:alkylhydroperoxidase family enzyme [Antricoccus suffuscus]|uniref:Alkylhydroperoxidase family enzyme n=1 Tax=Antricoccus suffuscus TaxID=1629062 RepID=A0A2T1A131_9ACTN|nr:carboxymuconolactone decarboxylase family protein [Antricoccus suffuscus]PRZ42315.1 alkylhydroperoxidase family enzyme [Antricoccus suffuscus]